VPLQVDVKATHGDRSVRHAVLSTVLPSLPAGEALTLKLQKGEGAGGAAATPAQLLAAGFTAQVVLLVDGKRYTASAEDALRAGRARLWLSGPVATEWLLAEPLRGPGGAHPHLTARFAVRWYPGAKRAKVDVTLENGWAYEPGPRNVAYDCTVRIGGEDAYTKRGLTHYHHARWKKTFWWGGEPKLHIRHDTGYLIATRAVPNYDRLAVPSMAALTQLQEAYAKSGDEPMASGLAAAYMPTTGGRPDLGLLPSWAVTYLLSMDRGAKTAMLGTADAAGSWSSHFRDKRTDRVVSVFDYPYMTLLGRESDTLNPATKKYESFPACGGDCKTPLEQDSSHQPSFAYLPYLVTGDYYYLEELQFWAMYNVLQHNPGYRMGKLGLVKGDQLRGQAWSLRTLAQAAYATPDADPLKGQFTTLLNNNLDYYNRTWAGSRGPEAALGAILDSNALVYDKARGIAPWQDDFFTMAVGHATELGFAKAAPLLRWKAGFPVQRMTGKGACWISAARYNMQVRDAEGAPFYPTYARVYEASVPAPVRAAQCGAGEMAGLLKLHTGEMEGYAQSPDGFVAYLQPALAYSVDSGHPDAKRAWNLFVNRALKPNYSLGAQFDILPREERP
jgi:hypothetical protein